MTLKKIRTHNIAILGTIFLTVILFTSQPLATAIDTDNIFELGLAQQADILGDGNSANGPDWADLFDANGNPTQAFDTVADSFVIDDLSVGNLDDSTTFQGGSNKNNDLIADWTWGTGGTPTKDDISNIYTTAIINPANDHLVIFAGVERLSPDGDSHVDIEFNQDQIRLDEPIPCDSTPCNFEGQRIVGDIVVSMDFLKGGGIGEVSIRQWDGTQFVLIETLEGEGCDDKDAACAFNNGGLINGGPWPNFDKNGNEITELEQNAFTEFGMDVTALFEEQPCITNFMSKTRSSQSFTAELKDFSPPTAFNVCSAFITIGPDAVNEVGDDHTFTVEVGQKVAEIITPASDGTIVDVDLTDTNGAGSSVSSDTCTTGTTNGKCTVTFTSNTAGTVTGHASSTVTINDLQFFVETDGTGSNSNDAVKRFVDARINISPDGVNSIGESHTFTVKVETDDGTGSGFTDATDGTSVSVSLADANGAVNSVSSDECADFGTSSGTCNVTFTSDTAGTVTGSATTTFTLDGVELTRTTDATGDNSDVAVKEFVSGTISWIKEDNAGNLLGGASFELCRVSNFNSESETFEPITPVCINVTDDSTEDQNANAGEIQVVGLVLGQYEITETTAPEGFALDDSVLGAEITLASPDATVSTAFVNERPIVKVTEFGYTNTPTGTPTQGVVSGSTTYTISLQNFGGADALSSVSLTVSATGLSSGTVVFVSSDGTSVSEPASGADCSAGCTVTWSGISLSANSANAATLTVTIEYDEVSGDAIQADLDSTYTTTTDSFERASSGSSAMIVFTPQEA